VADFVALYRGRTVSEAELIAVSAKPQLVERFFAELLGCSHSKPEAKKEECPVSILEIVHDG
jgi:hypothetical protein